MTETIISSVLLNNTLKHFNDILNHKSNEFDKDLFIKKSIPILFFGDIKKYYENDFKIVTAAINPSDREFKLNKHDKRFSTKFRFEDYDNSIESLEVAYSNYFKKNPYSWFGKKNNKHYNVGFKPVLNGMGYCFYPNKTNLKAVLHTDICSPIATRKKWRDISRFMKDELIKDGFILWKELINEIKPNLIILSISKDILRMLNPVFIENIYQKSSKYEVNLYKVNINGYKTNLIWASSLVTPFQPFSNKYEIGEIIKNRLLN